ncbi:lipopolysaccharide-induced tumor necrosis factor-alpha factor homolog [Drosophila subpulchrella]|uniref:lipopolysaccharide-induced tumor necrosis factor-alpha factor homolog n=1 Tax=Drosophila subpulchrella TaxID=1486046 RepID=UPI0018A163AF|nr:lipopolysaccharide-induced tumor necrosis factor-alpha factor homolog [Drosophila subpulchrella]
MEKNFPNDQQETHSPQAPPSSDNTQVYPNLHQPQPILTQPQIMQAPPNVLGGVPSVATCPSCGVRRETKVEFEPSTKTHLLALLICMLGGICCCCIPYCTDSCQSAKHTCSSCGAYVGTYKN